MTDFPQTIEIIYFLRRHFAGALFAVLPLYVVDEQYTALSHIDFGVVLVPFEAGASSPRWPWFLLPKIPCGWWNRWIDGLVLMLYCG